MDRDIAILIKNRLQNIKNSLDNIAIGTTPATSENVSNLSMVPLMTGVLDPEVSAPVEDSEVHLEEIEEPEPVPETTETRKKSTSK